MAVLLGLVFEGTVYGWTPGIGHTVFWLCALGATIVCNRAAERPALPSPWMFVPSLFFAASLFLYDSAAVQVWSRILGMLSLLWAVAWNLTKDREHGALGRLFPSATFHLGRLFRAGQETWKPVMTAPGKLSAPFLRGVLLAVPLLLIFGALLSSADMIFARALDSLQSGFGNLSFSFPLRLLLWLGLFAAWLKVWLIADKQEAPQGRSPFGATEVLVALGSVNLMLLAFLAIQVRYLFGGAALVEALGLNYADYARKGFFELSACIALILPLVMLAYQTAETAQGRRPAGQPGPTGEVGKDEEEFPSPSTQEFRPEPAPQPLSQLRWVGGLLVLQAAGLACSAFRRMLLYIDAYGMSVERFYAAAGILVALAVLAWAAFACLSPRNVSWVLTRQTVTVVFLLGALSLLNVEDGICRYNLSRAAQGKSLDIGYFRTLSCDAVPALAAGLSQLDEIQRKQCAEVIEGLVQSAGSSAGVSGNFARLQAQRIRGELLSR
jgi:hypothetical protein